jgi:two-component system sensor histidine kinase YesM
MHRGQRRSFKDLRIKHKLMIVMILVIVLICIVVLIGLQWLFRAYDDMLYVQSARSINNSISDIEYEILSAEKLSMTIAMDTRIQEQLNRIKDLTNEYDRMQALTDFKNKVFAYMLTHKHISSIRYVNDFGYDLMIGQSPQVPDESLIRLAISRASVMKGANVWIEPDARHDYLLAARAILSAGPELLEPLGTLIIQVNLESIIRQHQSSADAGNLYIWKGDRPIYVSDERFVPLPDMLKDKQGYTIRELDGVNSFIAYTTSSDTGWTYYNVFSYDDIFQRKNDLRMTLLVAVVLLLTAVIIISYRLSHMLTQPIEQLTDQMKLAEKGDLGKVITSFAFTDRADEIGYLEKRFSIMIQRINTLIEENYTRQIMLKDTEYRALQAQINPHFLYNTLTSINWLARSNGQSAISSMVESLGRLLRAAISNKEPMITIGEEIKLLQDYMNIQKVRYGHDLQFVLDIDERLHDYRIPKMSLQPIVENSVKHGLENMLEPCVITVSAEDTDTMIHLSVADNGPGMDEETLEKLKDFRLPSKGSGIGLKNIHERLQLLFGEEAGLSFSSKPGQGTLVIIKLPKEV